MHAMAAEAATERESRSTTPTPTCAPRDRVVSEIGFGESEPGAE